MAQAEPKRTGKTDEKLQQKRPERNRREDDTHQQRVRAAKALLDLQSKQLSQVAACNNLTTEAGHRLAHQKSWKEQLQPPEAIFGELQHEGVSRR